ncbi:MAG: tyrosine-type recombinase/integrase [Candidatus Obscuribacterales bacterium]
MIEQKFCEIKAKGVANATMRTLRALLFYAANRYEDDDGKPLLKSNVVRRLSETKAWHKDGKRKDLVKPHELKRWMQAVFSIPDTTTRDLLLLLVFSGLRVSEAINLRWEAVDLHAGTICLADTKNHESRTIPLSQFVWNMLLVRKFGSVGSCVFPSPNNPNVPMSRENKQYHLVRERSGGKWSYHSLRRTFVSIADELDIKTELIAELVGHKQDTITEGYTIRSVDRMRKVSQQITDAILVHSGLMEAKQSVISVEIR